MPPDVGRAAMRPIRVVKLGGSLAADPPRLKALLSAAADDSDQTSVVVPGGGAFADVVRQTQGALGFDDGLAHRLALDGMAAMAQVFHALEPRLLPAASAAEVGDALHRRRSAIWAPRDIRDGHPDIPESWDVTSDSLALWLAATLRAESCLLVKSADPPEHADPLALSRAGLVDRAFPDFAVRFSGRIVLAGPTRETVLSVPNEAAA